MHNTLIRSSDPKALSRATLVCGVQNKVTMLTRTDGGGDVFVGGAVPFGMVKLGLDTYEEPINQSALNGGWTPQGYVTGVSLMHESGTGGGAKYGFPSQMPLTSIDGDVNLLDNRTYWQKRVGQGGIRSPT